LRSALQAEGYEAPTPIQEQCIPPLLEGRDLINMAQTGTGKTAAFALPLLQHLSATGAGNRLRSGQPRALILAPTRELAAQIGDSLKTYGRFLSLRHTVVFGGVSQHWQVKALSAGIDILVATPGRLLDLMGQGHVRLGGTTFLVLDEVDRMLDMGFIHDIRRVLATLPRERQTMFFSATMPPPMEELARTMVRDAVRVAVSPDKPAVERIAQSLYFVSQPDKDALLQSVLSRMPVGKAIVFTRMKHVANKVLSRLEKAGIPGAALHGNKSQAARTKAMDGFRRGSFRVLVATDVAARGLDVDDVTHVINYDLPVEAETYSHRIGRTARAGLDGDAISFCSASERTHLRDIERLLGKPVPVVTDHGFHCHEASRADHRHPAPAEAAGGGRARPSPSQRRRGSGRHPRHARPGHGTR
jgi:ATP-dependent RNA helicase RhlE